METKSSPRLNWKPFAAILLAGLLLAWAASRVGPNVPAYQGKDLYAWVDQLQKAQQDYSNPERWKQVEAATQAIRAMGTNALPLVMADIQARVTVKEEFVNWLATRAVFLRLKPKRVEDRWVRGIRALEVLGPLGKPYLPELVNLVSNSTGYAESALLAVGPDALPALTNFLANSKFPQTGNLIGAFANAVYAERIKPGEAAAVVPWLVRVFQSSDTHGRWYAAGALGAVHQDPELCVPLLIQGLTDSASGVSQACVQSLGNFGEAASAHAGKLAEAFDQANADTRRAICGALANIRSAAPIAVPILVRGLRDPDEIVRTWAATGLGQLGSLPEQAVPALIQAVNDTNPVVRIMAVQSLGQLGAQTTNTLTAIRQCYLDQDARVRQAATNALNRAKLQ